MVRQPRAHATSVLSHAAFFGLVDRRLEAGGFTLASMRADPDVVVDTHTHETAHFILVAEGAYVSTARGAPRVCVRTTLIYNPPGTTHRDHFASTAGRIDGRFLSIAVSAEQLSRTMEHRRLAEEALVLDAPDQLAMSSRLLRDASAPDALSSLYAEGACLELLASSGGSTEPERSAPPAWLRIARQLLREQWDGELSVRALAHACGVHPVHLARAFRRHFGCSPATYARCMRVGRAASLLRRTRVPIADVALRAGFADQSQLTKSFRKLFGTTPAAYRRSHVSS